MEKSEILRNEYQLRFNKSEEYRDKVWRVLCDVFFSRYINSTDCLLDLGAGWGEFSRNIKAGKKYAMDLNPECGKRVDGFSQFLLQDCSRPWPIDNNSLDVVFTSNFLEHLPGKKEVELTLSEAFRCLKSNGKLIALGPNIRFLPGVYWDYWDHHIPISDASLAEVLRLQGFNIKINLSKFLPYTMSGGSHPPIIFLKAYLYMPFVWPLIGKQFFIVAEKIVNFAN